jgi:putative ABC transport system substrate-binding protein
MRRRQFIAWLAGATAWPLSVQAQQSAGPVVGFLNSAAPAEYAREVAAFLIGLAETGFTNGQNVSLEYRWAKGEYDRLPSMAVELVARRVSAIVANGPAARAAMDATKDIPIIFTAGFDPIRLGLVKSLNRPEANVTGISILNVEIAPKRLELLRELVPNATSFAFLINPSNPNANVLQSELQTAARKLGVTLLILHARTEAEIEHAFGAIVRQRAAGLIIGNDPFLTTRSKLLADLAMRHRIPAVYQYRDFAAEGGLMSYGASLIHTYRLAGSYAGKVLKGEKPSDLPVLQSTNIELIINLKAAKALNLTVPLPMLGRADEVVE